MDPGDVRRAARRIKERDRPDPLRRLALYGAAVLAVAALVVGYLNRETLLGIRLDTSALTSLIGERSATDVGAPGENREGEATVEAPAVAGARVSTSLDGEPVEDTPAAEPTAPPARTEPPAGESPLAANESGPEPAEAASAPAAAPEPEPPRPPPEPESFEFGLDRIAVAESAPSAAVLILRLGDRSRASTVTWWTEDGTAKAGSDYVSLGVQTEKFAAGEQNRTLHIPIVGDHNAEGPETFTAVVRGRAGEGDDVPVHRVEVTITDDD